MAERINTDGDLRSLSTKTLNQGPCCALYILYYAARWCVNHVTNHTHNLEIFASVTLLLRHRKEAFPLLTNSSDPWPFSVSKWDVLWPFDLVLRSLTFWTLEFPLFDLWFDLTNFRVGLLWVHDLLKCQHDFLKFLSALECHNFRT